MQGKLVISDSEKARCTHQPVHSEKQSCIYDVRQSFHESHA